MCACRTQPEHMPRKSTSMLSNNLPPPPHEATSRSSGLCFAARLAELNIPTCNNKNNMSSTRVQPTLEVEAAKFHNGAILPQGHPSNLPIANRQVLGNGRRATIAEAIPPQTRCNMFRGEKATAQGKQPVAKG